MKFQLGSLNKIFVITYLITCNTFFNHLNTIFFKKQKKTKKALKRPPKKKGMGNGTAVQSSSLECLFGTSTKLDAVEALDPPWNVSCLVQMLLILYFDVQLSEYKFIPAFQPLV